ncbi:MAG TPA: uroporphyrinogen decarboxylase [Candidatus Polarisedimenticolia bacterium]|nr:uroporphyrinogen decarboxylase [Candidatus Polarisedimenticolia bacterium]
MPTEKDPSSARFLRACRREATDCTPIWIMRQAGRYLPEYRKLRERHAMLDLAKQPDLAAQVTLMPVRRFALDAAILFSDIMVPAWGLGVPFRIEENVGPVIDDPLRTEKQIRALRVFDAVRDAGFVLESIRLIRGELGGKVPLIGFAGAPFTLASYLIEGRSPRRFRWTKAMMLDAPELWEPLMRHLADTVVAYLEAQAEAGAQALQIFDSWAGNLSPGQYERFAAPYSRRVFEALRPLGVPLIHFGTETSMLLSAMALAGGDVVGADWRIPLDEAWTKIGSDRAIQGNLDPAVLFANANVIRAEAQDVLNRAGGRPGHIFNLGHGILPETPVDAVATLVDFVHEASRPAKS